MLELQYYGYFLYVNYIMGFMMLDMEYMIYLIQENLIKRELLELNME